MKLKTNTLSGQRGFSLVELLVVIAVIGIIAAIAIPNIANITSQAKVAKDQRNAQNIASVASAAIAAGFNPKTEWNTAGGAIGSLLSGTVSVTSGTNVMSFGVSSMSTTEQGTAADFLSITTTPNLTVNYVPSGTAVVATGT